MAPGTAEQESKTMDPPANGRDAQGRFAKGNKGGPGNPFGRHLAQRRQVVAEAVSEEDLRQILAVLVAKAKEGDVPAAKLVLQYAVGKPQLFATVNRHAAFGGQILGHCLQACAARAVYRRARQFRPRGGVEGVIPVAVSG